MVDEFNENLTIVLCLLPHVNPFNPYSAELFVYKPWRPKGFFQFENIINVLVSSLHLTCYGSTNIRNMLIPLVR